VDINGQMMKVDMHFIRSEFRGLLPGKFQIGPIPNITQWVPNDQNDENLEVPSRYVPIESCDFLVDLEGIEFSEMEPNFSKMVSQK
jgi:alpha-1,2-mannosyltransferase